MTDSSPGLANLLFAVLFLVLALFLGRSVGILACDELSVCALYL
ncbi:hypothetical protein FVEN_g13164 [Fusarium venenatum]|nr:hypothetical protein FVEN_g13164 [Fusarium venenatum]